MLECQYAYPLIWPRDWPKTRRGYYDVSQFSQHSVAQARDFVLRQLELLEARKPIISTNLVLNKNGKPRDSQGTPQNPGVAIYFNWNGLDRVMACDKWSIVADNLWAIGLTLEVNRKQIQWGVVNILDRLFWEHVPPVPPQQEAPKPPPHQEAPKTKTPLRTWWEILRVSFYDDRAKVKAAYLSRAKETHPDHGGDHESFIAVQQAWEQACKERSWAL